MACPRSGETRLSFAACSVAEIRDRRDLYGVDPLVRQHDAIDATSAVTVLDRLHVEVVEQHDLAPHRMGQAPPAHDQHTLGWSGRPPNGSGGDPQCEVRGHGGQDHQGEVLRIERARRRQLAEEAHGHGPDNDPGADRRRLVHRQVPHRAMVGVVETRELRDEDPDRQEGDEPDRPLGGQNDREPETHRAAVGEGQQAPTPDVTPPARLTR